MILRNTTASLSSIGVNTDGLLVSIHRISLFGNFTPDLNINDAFILSILAL